MPVEKATSTEPLEIKGKKPNVKLNNGQESENITTINQLRIKNGLKPITGIAFDTELSNKV